MAWTDVSFDLETLGKRVDAPVLSIAAVAFDRMSGKLGPEVELHIKIDEALIDGRVDGGTLLWWLGQSAEARNKLIAGQKKAISTYEALRGLGDFVRGLPASVCVWGNGATFDISILERLYDVAGRGLKEQWQFLNIRDMRTIVDAADFNKDSIKFVGEKHVALDDARHQAKIITACLWKTPAGKRKQVEDDDEL